MVRLLICAGGTGGGVYPALVVRQVIDREASPVLWVGSEGGMEADLVRRAGIDFQSIPSGQVAGMGLRTPASLVKVARGVFAARKILNRFRPDVLFFTGGFVAVPMALAGWRIPSLVYAPDIEPGIALKLLARAASLIALTTPDSKKYFPAGKRVEVTGYPTRPELLAWDRERAIAFLGLEPGTFTLLVTGGSKGARTINQPVLEILPGLLEHMQVIHITGQAGWEETKAVQERLTASLPGELARRYHPMQYLHEMGAGLAAADLVVSRAGASTLGEYPLFGLPAILVPYQYAWRYQVVNAEYLQQRGAAVLMPHDRLAGELLPTILELSRNPDRLRRMSGSMRALAQPDAARKLADLILDLARKTGNREVAHG